jgi:uncharacterized protein YicC (UPF0701 family)
LYQSRSILQPLLPNLPFFSEFFFLASVAQFFFYLSFYNPQHKNTMAVLWQQQAPLLRKVLELLSQMQETMKLTVENSRQLVCKWDNVLAIVQELTDEEALNEQLKELYE